MLLHTPNDLRGLVHFPLFSQEYRREDPDSLLAEPIILTRGRGSLAGKEFMARPHSKQTDAGHDRR